MKVYIKKDSLTFPALFVLGVLLRIYYLSDFSFYVESADSAARALATFDLFNSSEHYLPSTIWLPFFFYLYQIPLIIQNSIHSILIFQFFLSCMNLVLFYYVVKKYFSLENARYSLLVAVILPSYLAMTSTANSNISFIFFVLLGLLFNNNTKLKLSLLSDLSFLLSAGIRYEGILIYACVILYNLAHEFSYKRLLYYIGTMSFYFILLETYFQYFGHSFFSGIFTNPSESLNVDSVRGIHTLFNINLLLGEYFWDNLGLFLVGLVILILKIKKYAFSNEYNFAALVLCLFWFLASQLRVVSIQERYWVIVFLLLIPLINKVILENKHGKRIYLVFLLSIIPFEKYYTTSAPSLETKKVVETIANLNCSKGIYIDDTLLTYHPERIRANLLLNGKNDCPIYSFNYTLNDDFSEEKRARYAVGYLRKQLKRERIDYVLLVKNSSVQLLLKKINIEKNNRLKRYEIVREFDSFIILKIDSNS